VIVLSPKTPGPRRGTPCRVCPDSQLVAYLNELMCGVGVGVSSDKRGGKIRPSAVMAAAVSVEALECEVLGCPRGVLDGIRLQKRHNVVFYRDVLAAPHRQVLEAVDARRKHHIHQRNARHGRVAEIQTGQARAVWAYDAH
jgi:hypothetical protein